MKRFLNHYFSLRSLVLFFAVVSGACLSAEEPSPSIILHLQNGDRITGMIIVETATEITVTSPTLGLIKIPTLQVKSRELGQPTLPTPTVVMIPKQTRPDEPKRWTTDMQFGMSLKYSTGYAQDYLAGVHTTYAKDWLRESLHYTFNYGKTEGILSANRMMGSSKTDIDISQRWYLYNLAGAGYDEVRRIGLQYEIGPGAGVMVVKSLDNNFVWRSELGFSYQEQFRNDDTDQITYSGRIAQLISWKIGGKLSTETTLEFFQNLQSFGDYRLRLETTLSYPLLRNISLNLIASDQYDTLPVVGISRNDFQVRSALGLRF